MQMEIITIESEAFKDLAKRLTRIEEFVIRTTHLLQVVDDELELSTKDLMDSLGVSESTLYRFRKKHLLHYRYTENGDIRYSFKALLMALKSNRLRFSGLRREEALSRLNEFKENVIVDACLISQRK